ncbi:MAG: helix-hairpin-helix domain-containing protein [Lachnospiraceae bacterium]|nr:helix-hairpin-helix domain-containing protein [Lachnospiraceae bacterium]
MQDKKKRIHAKMIRYAGLLLAVLLLSVGCTKKEELLLFDSGTSAAGEKPRTDGFWTEEAEAAPEGNQETDAAVSEENPGTEEVSEEAEPAQKQGVVYIHVCGAVSRPGVYELKAGSRVYEAVQAAGGFAEGADQDYVNQAQELSDGVKLVIPTLEEAAQAHEGEGSGEAAAAGMGDAKNTATQIGILGEPSFTQSEGGAQTGEGSGRININTASEAQLCDIPGIGATRAAAIAAYRESHGRFQKPEDIMKVSGIKEGMYEKIKDSISVN